MCVVQPDSRAVLPTLEVKFVVQRNDAVPASTFSLAYALDGPGQHFQCALVEKQTDLAIALLTCEIGARDGIRVRKVAMHFNPSVAGAFEARPRRRDQWRLIRLPE